MKKIKNLIILTLSNDMVFVVEKIFDNGEWVLKAFKIEESGETTRGVVGEYDTNKSLEDNLMDLWEYLDDFVKSPMGEFLFGD